MANEETYPLDDAAIEALAELEQHERSVQAILNYFMRQQKLSGNWTLARNRRELIRTVQEPVVDQ